MLHRPGKELQIKCLLLLVTTVLSISARPTQTGPFSDLEEWLGYLFYGKTEIPVVSPETENVSTTEITPTSPPQYAESCRCGVPERLVKRVVGGSKASIDKYPWLAGIQYYGMEYCEGTLISDRHVLTAAHCLKRIPSHKDLTLRLGSTRRAQRSIILKVKEIIRHPLYKPTNTLADIAVLLLEEPVSFENHLRPICLPNPDWSLTNKSGMVAGWGAKKEGGFPSRELLEVELHIVPSDKCRDVFRDVHDVFPTNICAGGVEGRDACQGDSGGPLMMDQEGVYHAIGLVSWGIGCARKGLPGVYTRVQSYVDWLHEVTASGVRCRSPLDVTQ